MSQISAAHTSPNAIPNFSIIAVSPRPVLLSWVVKWTTIITWKYFKGTHMFNYTFHMAVKAQLNICKISEIIFRAALFPQWIKKPKSTSSKYYINFTSYNILPLRDFITRIDWNQAYQIFFLGIRIKVDGMATTTRVTILAFCVKNPYLRRTCENASFVVHDFERTINVLNG